MKNQVSDVSKADVMVRSKEVSAALLWRHVCAPRATGRSVWNILSGGRCCTTLVTSSHYCQPEPGDDKNRRFTSYGTPCRLV